MAAVKICGVCSAADAALAVGEGADYVGVILAPGRSRTQSSERAADIFAAVSRARRVGVFVNATTDEVCERAAQLRLDVIQLHGDETRRDVEVLRATGLTIWKAVHVQSAQDVERALVAYHGAADALLLDGWSSGGAGVRFDWQEVAPLRARWPLALQLVAAGGLRAENVGEAIAALAPDVVNVSSGVEETLCVKSPDKVRNFISAARAAADGKVAR